MPTNATTQQDVGLGPRLAMVVRLYKSRKYAAEVAGISVDQLSAYERESNEPRFSVLARLASNVGVSLDWLATGKGEMRPGGVSVFRTGSDDGSGPPSVCLRRYNVRASAGDGAVVDDEQVTGYMTFPRHLVTDVLRVPADTLVVVEATGENMEPTIADGDLLLVDTRVRTVKNDAIYVLLRGDDLVVKRIQLNLDGSLTVRSDNPVYGPEEIPADRAENLRLIGQVVWFGRQLR